MALPLPSFFYYLMLSLPQGFNEEIERSKKNFTDRKQLIPIIKELIKSAIDSGVRGQGLVRMAANAMDESRSVLTVAMKTINDTTEVGFHLFCNH